MRHENLIVVEPAVGSTPPWAGVTPAPSVKKKIIRFPFPRGKGLGVRFLAVAAMTASTLSVFCILDDAFVP